MRVLKEKASLGRREEELLCAVPSGDGMGIWTSQSRDRFPEPEAAHSVDGDVYRMRGFASSLSVLGFMEKEWGGKRGERSRRLAPGGEILPAG